jgi:hypothetical protein
MAVAAGIAISVVRVELVIEIERVRWRAPDGAFAVVDGVTDEG